VPETSTRNELDYAPEPNTVRITPLIFADAAWPCKTANGQYNSVDLSSAKLAGVLD
jgi:hypothetical protein